MTTTETELRRQKPGEAYRNPHMPWSEERRMRDSNPRGVAPNTLSKSVGGCSAVVGTVRDLLKRDRVVFDGRLCTAVNETETETRAVLPPRPSTPHAVGAQIM